MSAIDWLTGMFSRRAKAQSLFARAMEKAKNKDTDGALEDYGAVIRIEKSSSSLRSMAMFNRALAYSAAGQYDEAKVDLEAVLADKNTPANVRAAAKAKVERMRKLAR